MFKVKKDKDKMRVIEDDAKGNAVSSVDTVVFVFRHTYTASLLLRLARNKSRHLVLHRLLNE